MALWKTSEAVLMPKGILRNLNRPKGVANVVWRDEASSSLICQNELFASRTEKTVAPDIWAATSSTVRMGW